MMSPAATSNVLAGSRCRRTVSIVVAHLVVLASMRPWKSLKSMIRDGHDDGVGRRCGDGHDCEGRHEDAGGGGARR